ncbi:hypothetical protein HK105_202696 [Polyrhizophydium stewartii]|uniref:Uncharacterized protein n=1 Tax=Polyrhizophydium stewartii TaxID=2732419 RepID=A0ABR4NE78_9FUNG|nr:hypothetical protein HK105_004965 [Polyrhizophydium stewartii]
MAAKSTEHLNHLLTAAQRMFAAAPAVSRHLVSCFIEHAVAGNVAVTPALRRRLCWSCGSIAVPGLTSSVSTVSVGKQRRRTPAAAGGRATQAGAKHTHPAPFRVPPEPMRLAPAEPGQTPRSLATNVRSACLVCGFVSFLPGISTEDLAAVSSRSAPAAQPTPAKRRADGGPAAGALPDAQHAAGAPPAKRPKTAQMGTIATPSASAKHSTPASQGGIHGKAGPKHPQPTAQEAKPASAQEAAKKKKKDKQRNDLKSLLKKQQEEKDKKAGSRFSLQDFLADV